MKIFLPFLCLLCSICTFAQVPLDGVNDVVIDFDNTVLGVNNGQFTANGFNATPATGQLNSNAFIVTGFSDGDLNFGDAAVGGDYGQGTTTGGVTTPGIYALTPLSVPGFPSYTNLSMDAAASGNLLALQPGANDFEPGTVVIRAQNTNPTEVISGFTITADFCQRGDGDNSATYTLEYSTDNINYTSLYSTTTVGPAAGQILSYLCFRATPTPVSVMLNPGDYFYVRLTGSLGTVSGTDYDEIAVDNITFSSIVLPVKLVYFNAATREQSGVVLNWQTAWEQNSDYFEVQRSQDGRTFIGLGEVSAAGFADTETTYSYVDKTAPAGVSYYRLRQVDFDGTEDFSEVVTVEQSVKGADQTISVAPNPTADQLRVRTTEPFAAGTRIQVFGPDGRLYIDTTSEYQTEVVVDLSGLSAGAYHLRVIDALRVEHFAVQKQ